MFDWVQWFSSHLQSSGEGFVWAFSQIKPSFYHVLPPDPDYLGKWSPARHLWHVAEYERCLALPSMSQWLGKEFLFTDDLWPDDDSAWSKELDLSLDALVDKFWDIRRQQIGLLEDLKSVDWDKPRETLWGNKPLSMVVTKTYQHTFEHGNTILKMGLWWDDLEQEEIAKKAIESST